MAGIFMRFQNGTTCMEVGYEPMDNMLGRLAHALHQHGQSVLRGDFSVFDDARAPDLDDTELYDVRAFDDATVGSDEFRRPQSFPVQLAAWVARRLGRIGRRELPPSR